MGQPSVATTTTHPPIRRAARALLAPRRLVPILLVCTPLVIVQVTSSPPPLPLALLLGALMCGAFVGLAPISYQVLFARVDEIAGRHLAVRLALYATIGAGAVLTIGVVLPRLLNYEDTFLSSRGSLSVCGVLFLVGGWGLSRDITFEDRLAHEKARTALHAREAEMAQLLALRSHLDPHFLFNTLNAIAEWCREDGVTAERAVLQLSALLREVLAGVRRPTWPLRQELELVRTLFALHLLRDPDRFTVEVRVPDPLPDVEVPPMLLLPLAENAVTHGPAAGNRGAITLCVEADATHLRVTLENPGAYRGPREGSDGLPTVEKRLALAYDGGARLEIRAAGPSSDRTLVEVRLPRTGPLTGAVT